MSRIAPAFAAPAIGGNRRIAPGLYEIVVNPTTNRVYVAAAGQRGANDASIMVLDPVTLEASSAIELRDEPAFGLALNNRTQTLYTTNTRSGSVSAIDLRDNPPLPADAQEEVQAFLAGIENNDDVQNLFVGLVD